MPRSSFKKVSKKAKQASRKKDVIGRSVIGSINTGSRGFSLARTKRVTHSYCQQVTMPIGTATSTGYGYWECPITNLFKCPGNINTNAGTPLKWSDTPAFHVSGTPATAKGYMDGTPTGFDIMQKLYRNYRVTGATVKVQRIPVLEEQLASKKGAAYVVATLTAVGGVNGTGTTATYNTGDQLGKKLSAGDAPIAHKNTTDAGDLGQLNQLVFLEKNLVQGWNLVRGGASPLDHMAMVCRVDPKKVLGVEFDAHAGIGHTLYATRETNPGQNVLFTLYEFPANQGRIDTATTNWDPELAADSGTNAGPGVSSNPGYTYQIMVEYDVTYSEPIPLEGEDHDDA